jgi:hypothetical protein
MVVSWQFSNRLESTLPRTSRSLQGGRRCYCPLPPSHCRTRMPYSMEPVLNSTDGERRMRRRLLRNDHVKARGRSDRLRRTPAPPRSGSAPGAGRGSPITQKKAINQSVQYIALEATLSLTRWDKLLTVSGWPQRCRAITGHNGFRSQVAKNRPKAEQSSPTCALLTLSRPCRA